MSSAMMLVADVGNTHACFALMDQDGRMVTQFRLPSPSIDLYSQILPVLDSHLRLVGRELSDISDFAFATVVRKYRHIFQELARFMGLRSFALDYEHAQAYVQVALAQPQKIGADRLANAFSVLEEKLFPAIVVDMGTATTFDVIDAKGVYQGGIIMPGFETSYGNLIAKTDLLSPIDLSKYPSFSMGQDTASAMAVGIISGYCHQIKGLLTDLRADLGPQYQILATGGWSEKFAQWLPDFIGRADLDLTMRGVYYYAQKVKSHESKNKASN